MRHRLTMLLTLFAATRALIRDARRPKPSAPAIDAGALAQFHAAEYAAERNSVDVWKTLQYAIIPIMFAAWVALAQVRQALPDERIFYWAGALVVPLCFVAYQKAMVDALEGLLLIETYVRQTRPRAAARDHACHRRAKAVVADKNVIA